LYGVNCIQEVSIKKIIRSIAIISIAVKPRDDSDDEIFAVGGSNGAISVSMISKMAAGRHLKKFRMNIPLEWVIRSTFMKQRTALQEYGRE